MDNTQLQLAKLHDIYLPHPVSWWPLAIGWYGLMVLTLIMAITVYFICRSYFSNKAKRNALRLLSKIEQQYIMEKNCKIACIMVSELLRRVALVYFQRHEVAGLQGQLWIEFLSRTGKGINFTEIAGHLIDLPFQFAPQKDLTLLFSCAKAWIQQRKKPCLK